MMLSVELLSINLFKSHSLAAEDWEKLKENAPEFADYPSLAINGVATDEEELNQFFTILATNTTVKYLIVQNCGFTKKHNHFWNKLKTEQSLYELTLSGCTFEEGNFQSFAINLSTNTSLNTFVIQKCLLSTQSIQDLAAAITKNKSLDKFYVNSVSLSVENVASLSAALKDNLNLREVSLAFCEINDEGIVYLVEAIKDHSKLKTIYLNNNMIGDVGGKQLAIMLETMLKGNRSFDNLYLQNNKLSKEVALLLFETVVKHHCSFSLLSLIENEDKVGITAINFTPLLKEVHFLPYLQIGVGRTYEMQCDPLLAVKRRQSFVYLAATLSSPSELTQPNYFLNLPIELIKEIFSYLYPDPTQVLGFPRPACQALINLFFSEGRTKWKQALKEKKPFTYEGDCKKVDARNNQPIEKYRYKLFTPSKLDQPSLIGKVKLNKQQKEFLKIFPSL